MRVDFVKFKKSSHSVQRLIQSPGTATKLDQSKAFPFWRHKKLSSEGQSFTLPLTVEKDKDILAKMDYEGQDSFLDSKGDKKQPSVQRPVQVRPPLNLST